MTSEKDKWQKIFSHTDKEIKGFFGDYRFLSNFWPAKIFLDDEEYQTVENAYHAAKYKKESREFFKKCHPREISLFIPDHPMDLYSESEWNKVKFEVMRKLLVQKFDKNLNPENYEKLKDTGTKYLEETNYWEDTYWGVYRLDAKEQGTGENNLGKLLMEVRDK